ncbi:transient receptor potential cation channel subfamily A member 1 homolog [Strongylocentrotus purpuratus]|uniref:Ion transport domain-containing protein n=1 Tax=Strongylocentrotus purpuratus TaxID=7668 RepID=A0A7M7PBY1_STRPU|nr:transient receptor potential cation channel subfamily A member 1 homolog [Strongylocentrotus purpuratus]
MDNNEADGSPPLLKFTALKGSTDCLVVLLKHVKEPSTVIELIKWVSAEKNFSKVLEELLSRFDYICSGNFEAIDVEKIILLCAARGHTESLLQFIAWHKHSVALKDDNENTVLHLIAEGGHLDTAKAIIKKDNAVLNERNSLGQTALHLAIREGHKQMTKLFLKTEKSMAGVQDDNGMTPLMYACQKGNPVIVDLLLELKPEEIMFRECDKKGLNCLDYAINHSHEMVAVQLLSQENWRTLMTHSTNEGDTKTTPMRKLIEYMPGVCKFVLDKCITKLPASSSSDRNCTKIRVYYELLEDWFSDWMEDTSIWRRRMTLDTLATRGYDMMLQTIGHAATGDSTNGNARDEEVPSNFLPDGKLRDGARIYVTNPVYRSHNHPVRLMIKTDESKELLNHPVLRLFFLQKHKATRLTYWVSFFLLLALLILVTGHSLVIPPPFYIRVSPEGSNYTWLADGQTKWQENLNPVALVLFGKVGAWIILVLTVIYFIEFLYRTWMYRHSKYNSINGIMSIFREIGIQIFTVLYVFPGFNDVIYGYGVHFKADWQWQLGAFAVFLVWFNFILFLQTVPFFGIYVLMFLEVLSTLLNFIFLAGIFLLAFAVVFCILLLNQAPFHTLGDSLSKALAMMTGEIELSAVFHILDYSYMPDPSVDFTSLVFYPVSTHIIYVIFIIFMPILIMNLLTGLAVYDIEVIQTKAKMHKQTLEAKGTLDFQNNMFLFLWKASVVRDQVIPVWTKISPIYKLVYKVTGYKETYDQLVTFLEDLDKTGCVEFTKTTEMKLEGMAENITDIANRLTVLSENAVDEKTRHIEAMGGIQALKQQVQALHNKL